MSELSFDAKLGIGMLFATKAFELLLVFLCLLYSATGHIAFMYVGAIALIAALTTCWVTIARLTRIAIRDSKEAAGGRDREEVRV